VTGYCTRCGHWGTLAGWLCAGCRAAWMTRYLARNQPPVDLGSVAA
jgi:hypothetical protein